MIIAKRFIMRSFLLAEVIVVLVFFTTGPQGIHAIAQEKEEQVRLCKQIEQEQIEVDQLKKQIDCHNKHDFYKEKIAREHLQMARPEEEVYVLD